MTIGRRNPMNRPDAGLSGKVVAITGASGGIGAAAARACARRGAAVALAARREHELHAVARHVADLGGTALPHVADVSDERQATAFIEAAHRRFGRLDALVNNAGILVTGGVDGANTEDWRRMIDANIYGVLYCTHAAFPLMKAAGGGHIVNVSSVSGRTARADSAVYNLTKWGLNGFSEGLRLEALQSNVRVTVIEPGMVRTPMHGSPPPATGEWLEPDDVASAIVYALTQPEHVALNEVMVRPSRQAE